MPRIGVVFPGQGSQYVGMGRDLVDNFEVARKVFECADDALGYSLTNLCFEGTVAELNRTEVTQPAILTVSVAVWQVLKSLGIKAEMAAGLSLGEYSALVVAGVIELENAVKLVARRGRIMQEAVPEGQGMMAACLGLEAENVVSVCQECSSKGLVSIANYNCPGQLVISGNRVAVESAGEVIKARGGRYIPLAVSVPSHSLLMREAAIMFAAEIEDIVWHQPAFPVISNVTAREVAPEELQDILVKQLYSPVRWQQSVEYMAENVDFFVELGPGKSLSALIKKISRSKLLGNIEDNDSMTRVLNKLRGE